MLEPFAEGVAALYIKSTRDLQTLGGFDLAAASESGGLGLLSMRERAERWGGTLRVRQRSPKGTTVRAVIPLPVSVPHARAAARES